MLVIPRSKRIGRILKERRISLGLTQVDVSQLLGYSNPASIRRWERGVASSSLSKFKQLMKIYKITGDEWLSILMAEFQDQISR